VGQAPCWRALDPAAPASIFATPTSRRKKPCPSAATNEHGTKGLTLKQAREKAGEISKLYQSGITDLHGHLERERQAAERARQESRASGVTDFGSDLVDAGAARLEKMHRARYPQVLDKGERRLAQHALYPARQGALAGAQCLRGLIEREASSQASARPALECRISPVRTHPISSVEDRLIS
jgi:hypothetical protein